MAKTKKEAKDKNKKPSYVNDETPDIPEAEGGGLPAVKLLQAISPECTKGDEKYIKGAEASQFLFTGTEEVYDGEEGLTFIPLQARKSYEEWIPRKQGGGFVASYDSRVEAKENMDPANDLAVSIEYACHFPELEAVALLRFDSPTKLGIARKLGDLIEESGTMYGREYQLTSARKKNKAGQTYYNLNIAPGEWVAKKAYKELADMAAQAAAGQLEYDKEDSEV